MQLNRNALRLCDSLAERAERLRVAVKRDECGARIFDCGVFSRGGLEAGRCLAEICLAGVGCVDIVPADPRLWDGAAVVVRTDQPVAGCMAAQYAGWQIAGKSFFAMGSGPMRAAGSRESLFDQIGYREHPKQVVGALEASALPVPARLPPRGGRPPRSLSEVTSLFPTRGTGNPRERRRTHKR